MRFLSARSIAGNAGEQGALLGHVQICSVGSNSPARLCDHDGQTLPRFTDIRRIPDPEWLPKLDHYNANVNPRAQCAGRRNHRRPGHAVARAAERYFRVRRKFEQSRRYRGRDNAVSTDRWLRWLADCFFRLVDMEQAHGHAADHTDAPTL